MKLSYNNAYLRRLYYRLPPLLRESVATIYALKQYRSRFGGVFNSRLSELIEHANWSADEVAADQLQRLRATLIYAGAHVPYYRALFQQLGFEPASIRSIADLQRLPMLDKETVRSQFERLEAQPPIRRAFINHTSGTTGKALHLTISEEANQTHYACQWFHFGWAGIQSGERIATFAGHPVAAIEARRPPYWLHNWFDRELLFSSSHIAPDNIPAYVEALAAHQPALVRGYPSSIYLVAFHLLDSGRVDIRPKGIFTWAETLFPHQREVIEAAFGCRAYSSYGNGERTGLILQCEFSNFHVVTEACVAEMVDHEGRPAAPGQMGELVVTSLINRAMPLIRYRVGDIAVQGQGACPCGRTTPILSDIIGRSDDFVVTPDGRQVGRLDHVFKDTLSVKEAQLVQDETGSLTVKIVPRPSFNGADETRILEELRLRLGTEITINLQRVDQIPRTANGKLRMVISKVPIKFGHPGH